jgi:hypothetical protein
MSSLGEQLPPVDCLWSYRVISLLYYQECLI